MATVDKNSALCNVPFTVVRVQLSSLTAGAPITLSPSGMPNGATPDSVSFEVLTRPTDGSLVGMVHSADTSSTSTVRFDCPAGGSLDGAVVAVYLTYLAAASGGKNPS